MFGRAGRMWLPFKTSQLNIRWFTNFTSIPIIDVSPLLNNAASRTEKKIVGDKLHEACRNVGFFYISNHGVPPEVYNGVLSKARDWFSLPENKKQQLAVSPQTNYRGYQVLGMNVTRYDGGFQRDWHEALDLYKEVDANMVLKKKTTPSPVHGLNPWPHHTPGFTDSLQLYVNHMRSLGSSLMEGIALGLELPQDFFAGAVAGPEENYWYIRVIHYPPLVEHTEGTHRAAAGAEVERSVQLSCGEHTDYGLLTLVNQEPDVTALQVKNSAGHWVDATPIPGTFVCNIGDMLKVWTNGLYQPTPHRVINTSPTRSRVSIPFFYEPCFDALVEPLPKFCKSAPPKFPPIMYGAHLEQKVLSNFE